MPSSGVTSAVWPRPIRRSGAVAQNSAIQRLYALKHARWYSASGWLQSNMPTDG